MKKNKTKSDASSCKEEPVIQLPRKRAMAWLVVFCFISVWIFFLGILVGRGMAPVQFDIDGLQKELTDLRLALLKKEQQLTQSDNSLLSQKPDFEFHEKVKQSDPDTDVPFERQTAVESKPASSETPAHKTRNITKTKHLAAKAPKTPPPAPAGPNGRARTAEKEKKLTIQVASLRDPKVADQLVAALIKKGFPAYKTVGIISENDIWYRVRAGHFASREESRPMMARIKKEYRGAILLNR